MSAVGGVLWWIGLGAVVVVVFPAVAYLALRIIRSLAVIHAAAQSIRSSLGDVASGMPPAMDALDAVASRCERIAPPVTV